MALNPSGLYLDIKLTGLISVPVDLGLVMIGDVCKDPAWQRRARIAISWAEYAFGKWP